MDPREIPISAKILTFLRKCSDLPGDLTSRKRFSIVILLGKADETSEEEIYIYI